MTDSILYLSGVHYKSEGSYYSYRGQLAANALHLKLFKSIEVFLLLGEHMKSYIASLVFLSVDSEVSPGWNENVNLLS